jgi:hypothetical protein
MKRFSLSTEMPRRRGKGNLFENSAFHQNEKAVLATGEENRMPSPLYSITELENEKPSLQQIVTVKLRITQSDI